MEREELKDKLTEMQYKVACQCGTKPNEILGLAHGELPGDFLMVLDEVRGDATTGRRR